MMQEMCRKVEYIFYLVCKIGGIIINVANLEFFSVFLFALLSGKR